MTWEKNKFTVRSLLWNFSPLKISFKYWSVSSLVTISFYECNFVLHWIRRYYPCGCWECAFGNNVNSGVFPTTLAATGKCPQLASGLQIKAVIIQLSSCFLRFLVSYHKLRHQHIWSSYMLANKFSKSCSTKLHCSWFLPFFTLGF